MSLRSCMPQWKGSPAVWQTPSFTRNGTPRNGPSASAGSAAAAIALSSRRWITAFSWGLSLSMRAIADSTSSVGVTSPLRTSSAWAVASIHARSLSICPSCLLDKRTYVRYGGGSSLDFPRRPLCAEEAVFDEVRNAVAVLEASARALEPWRLDSCDAVALVEVAAHGERVCAAIKGLAARRVDETKVWRDGGHRDAAHWVAEATGATVGAATRTLETARALDELPATEEAFRAGKLSETQAAEITSTAVADPG